MYNRYIRNTQGTYERIFVPDSESSNRKQYQEIPSESQSSPPHTGSNHQPSPRQEPHHEHNHRRPPPPDREDKKGLLSGILNKLKLDEIDTGDLLLLLILFLLFKEGDDDELLIALGLLLIL